MEQSPIKKTYFDDIFKLRDFITIVFEGFGYFEIAEKVTDKIREISLEKGAPPHPLSDDSYYKNQKEHVRKLATFSKQEKESGYTYLFSMAIVKLWSILEAAADDIILNLLKDRNRLLTIEAIRKFKAPIIEFLSAPEDEQTEFFLEQLKQELGSSFKLGVGRFESLFKILGIGGPVEDLSRRGLLDFSEIRNAIVHNKAIADRRVVERCPWRKLKLGDPIKPVREDFLMYFDICVWYMLELDGRWDRVIFKRPDNFPETLKTSEFKEEVLNDIKRKWEFKLT